MKANELWKIAPLCRPEAVVQGERFRISVLTNRLFRLEYSAEGRFCDSATQTVLCRQFPLPAFSVRDEEEGLTIETDAVRLCYNRQAFSAAGLSATLKGAFSFYVSKWHYGDSVDTLGGTTRTLDEADGAVPLADGLMSAKGCAILDDSHAMRMDSEGGLHPAQENGIDLYLFAYGHDFAGCLRDYLTLSGSVPPIPRFALGNWWSRFYPYTQEGYQALMERFRQEEIPLCVAVLDMNWHVTQIDPQYGTGWTGYTWDREKFPDPEQLLAWLHAHGLMVTLNDHPADGIRPCEESHARMARAMGEDPAEGNSYPFDAANEAFLHALEETVLAPLERQGVDFWWLDWQQKGGTSKEGMEPLFVLNHTRYLHALEAGKPAMILSRYAGPGSHRYPLGFSGDTCATWASLDFQPFFTAAAADIGYTWWSHDIGGHMHGVKDDELAVRWLQFGAFSPILRLHSSTGRFLRKEPWLYPVREARIMKRFLRLRHRLIPWLYTQNLLCSRENKALLRPMYYDYPLRHPFFASQKNQYLLGDCLLICPITRPADPTTGLAAVRVDLPEGGWRDFFTGSRYRGGRSLTLYRPLEEIPVLVRDGGILPMDGADRLQNGVELPTRVHVRLYPDASGEAVLVEDNGLFPGEAGYQSATTRIHMRVDEGLCVELEAPEGDVSILPENRSYVLELCGVALREPVEADCAWELVDGANGGRYIEVRGAAQTGASLRWDERIPEEKQDWRETLETLLMPVKMPFDQKERIMYIAQEQQTPLDFLARLHPLELPSALQGAILELLYCEAEVEG